MEKEKQPSKLCKLPPVVIMHHEHFGRILDNRICDIIQITFNQAKFGLSNSGMISDPV